MRQLLVLFLACLPLAGLTAWSFVEALSSSATAASGADALNLDENRQASLAAAGEAGAAQPLTRALERGDLLSQTPLELPAQSNELFQRIVDAWKRSEHARALAERSAAALPRGEDQEMSPAARRAQAESSLSKLHQVLSVQQQDSVDQIPGADALIKLLQRRANHLQDEVARYRREDNIMDALAQAAADLDAGRYDACLSLLSAAPLDELRAGELGDQAQSMRKRAEYRQAIEALLSRQPQTEADRDLLADIEAFFRKAPAAPSSAEVDLRARLMHKRNSLQLAIAIDDLANPPDLQTLLAQAAAIVAHEQADQLTRERIRSHVMNWLLEKGFPRLEAPQELIGKQEAVTKNEQRKIGIFFLPPGAEQWRVWRSRRDREQRPRGDEQIPRDSFVQPPSTPMYVAWAQGYNDESARLIKQGGSLNEWQDFARRCDEWQQELTAYREKWGVEEEPDRSCREWSFLDAAATARTVIGRWRQFEQVLGKST